MKIKKIFKQWLKKSVKLDYCSIEYVESLSDVPQNPGSTIFIVRSKKTSKWVVFQCPNHCGKRIEVNLMKSRHPHWTLKVKKRKVTLWPSVIVNDCGAHFWLRDGRVIDSE